MNREEMATKNANVVQRSELDFIREEARRRVEIEEEESRKLEETAHYGSESARMWHINAFQPTPERVSECVLRNE